MSSLLDGPHQAFALTVAAGSQRAYVGAMAQSTCVKCGNNNFEMVERDPKHSMFRYAFIQCTNCGGVAGIVDAHNVANLVYKLAAALKVDIGQ